MKRCATCRHWQKPALRVFGDGGPAVSGGHCQSEGIREAFDRSDYQPDRLVYDYMEGGTFWTGPEFGCVHHEESADGCKKEG